MTKLYQWLSSSSHPAEIAPGVRSVSGPSVVRAGLTQRSLRSSAFSVLKFEARRRRSAAPRSQPDMARIFSCALFSPRSGRHIVAHGASRGDGSHHVWASPARGDIRPAQIHPQCVPWADAAPPGAPEILLHVSFPTAAAVGHITSALTGLQSDGKNRYGPRSSQRPRWRQKVPSGFI